MVTQNIRRFVLATACSAVALFGAVGCGGPVQIQGQVVWEDGTPARELEGGMVMFRLPGQKKAVGARGTIGADGAFTMSTMRMGDGVFPGTHLAAVIENRPGGGDSGIPLAPARMDPKYSDPDTSGLTVLVEQSNQDVQLKVNRKGK
jgi:hypothetical protein